MSLIDECKKLRGLEQKYKITPYDGNLEVYSLHLREHGSAMLEVLSMIQEGDAEKLEAAANWLKTTNANQVIIEAMDRAVHMAALMEKEMET